MRVQGKLAAADRIVPRSKDLQRSFGAHAGPDALHRGHAARAWLQAREIKNPLPRVFLRVAPSVGAQSGRIFAVLMTAAHLAMSARMKLSSSAGVLATTSTPSPASLSLDAGASSPRWISVCRRST